MKKNTLICICIVVVFLSSTCNNQEKAQWNSDFSSIATRWAELVTPENAWKEYPRPQMQREQWLNLNGLWDYSVTHISNAEIPQSWKGKILVPFAIEAPLSGVGEQLSEEELIWYYRTFSLPEKWKKDRIMLHFEASAFETNVWVNYKFIGTHKGAYHPFSFDISDAILHDKKIQEISVNINNPSRDVYRAVGKQRGNTEHYENCSGIWQTVWLEPVPVEASIASLKINPSLEDVTIQTYILGKVQGLELNYEVYAKDSLITSISSNADESITFKIPSPKLWSPESPFLYDLKVSILKGSEKIDEVKSYFGLRTIEVTDSEVLLNGSPIFMIGPLDQNYWPDGVLTPPSDAAMAWEVDYLKRIGCNLTRLHVKTNPRRYYFHTDRLGLLVMQDFVNARGNNPTREEVNFWFNEHKQIMETLYNHPSIVTWVIFNEGWGQNRSDGSAMIDDSKQIFDKVQALDDSRLIILASGWVDVPGVGDIRDVHDYTMRPAIPVEGTDSRIPILGEFGGFFSAVPPHNWTGRSNQSGTPVNLLSGRDNYVPRDNNSAHDIFRPTFTRGEPWANQYNLIVDHLNLLRNSGLRAAVYTQMTDMKLEENGYLTFDRKVSKVNEERLAKIHEKLFNKPPVQDIILPPSSEEPRGWEMAVADYPALIQRSRQRDPTISTILQEIPDFNSLNWIPVHGPFAPKSVKTGSIWDGEKQLFVRKSFNLSEIPQNASIRIYTTKLGEIGNIWIYSRIYINGKFVADESTRQIMPENRIAEVILSPEAMKYLEKGENQIIVQFIPGYETRDGVFAPLSDNDKFMVDISITGFMNL